jgi:ADP-ribose pyrophosphatase YjhB (NUDIX family)
VNVTRLAAYALTRDGDGQILLARIAPGYPGAGQWTLPGGGVQFGEDPEATVTRELTEETGLEGQVLGLAFVHSGTGPSQDGGAWHAIRIVYRVEIVGGELRDETDESTDMAAWFSPDQARRVSLVDLAQAALDHAELASAD